MMSPSRTAHAESETAFQAHNFIFRLDDFGLEPLFILYLFIYLFFCVKLPVTHCLIKNALAAR